MGSLVDVVELNVCLKMFGLVMKKFSGRVVLLGNNIRTFDMKHF